VCRSVVQCVVVCCSVLHCVAAYCLLVRLSVNEIRPKLAKQLSPMNEKAT